MLVNFLNLLGLLRHVIEDPQDDGQVGVIDLLGIGIALVFHHSVDGAYLAGKGGVQRVAVAVAAEKQRKDSRVVVGRGRLPYLW